MWYYVYSISIFNLRLTQWLLVRYIQVKVLSIEIFLFVTSSLFKTSWQLVLSVFSQADLQKLESHTKFTTNVVAALYLIFLVLSVIMLINMLVALLNHTYDNVKVGSNHSNHNFLSLLDRHEFLLEMYTTCKIHTNWHLGPRWHTFHILIS